MARSLAILLIAGWFLAGTEGVAASRATVGDLATAAEPAPVPVRGRISYLQRDEESVIDLLLKKYGSTDWTPPLDWILENPSMEVNPNVIMIPLSLANARLARWRRTGEPSEFDAALTWSEWVADHHEAWGERWLSPLLVCYLDLTTRRLESAAAGSVRSQRAASLRAGALSIEKEEADARLTSAYPFLPLDSSQGGDSKAEEDAWEAALLAAAANSLPFEQNQPLWDEKARQLAYDSITLASDPPDSAGVKTVTVRDDFDLPNHGFAPNEYYTAATLNLLRTGTLFYRLSRRPIPPEFSHHVDDLFAVYRSHVDSSNQWTAPCDEGDATLFPLADLGEADFERRLVSDKALAGFLWKPGGPVSTIGVGNDLWEAIQDSKTVEQYVVGSYLWHFSDDVEIHPAAAAADGVPLRPEMEPSDP